MNIYPISFAIGPAQWGWIDLTISIPSEIDVSISCSNVYDPWKDIVGWVEHAACGLPGAVEIDEEGHSTILWLDREPGSWIGRLRVFKPDEHGGVETSRLDVSIDIAQMCKAFLEVFSEYARTYDAKHWDDDDDGPEPVLSRIDLYRTRAVLNWMRVLPDDTPQPVDDWHAAGRDASRRHYESQLGACALPVV